jgi:hypothetical protein
MKPNTNVTVHNPESGESATFGPNDDLPGWAEKIVKAGNPDVLKDAEEQDETPVPGPSQAEADLIGSPGGGEDPLMGRTKADLVAAAEQVGAADVSDSNTKAELVAAIRATGYDGDGSDL